MDLLRFFDETTMLSVQARRRYLSTKIRSHCNSTVIYGILKGFRVPHSSWSEIASSSYILGTYEVAICAILDAIKGSNKTLIDLGGADGIFGVGLVEVGAFAKSMIFEMDPARQTAIVELVQSRNLSSQISVYGEARHDFTKILDKHAICMSSCVVLCDIEGAEFDLFTPEVLSAFKDAHVIIELHDSLILDPQTRATSVEKLKRDAEQYFDVIEVRDGLRDIRNIRLLRGMSDWDSWLLCVEARDNMMSWLWLRPKHEAPLSPAAVDALVIDYQRRIFSEEATGA